MTFEEELTFNTASDKKGTRREGIAKFAHMAFEEDYEEVILTCINYSLKDDPLSEEFAS